VPREPFVAAVVVTYRRPASLLRAVDAIRRQTVKPDLTIVVDNGDDAETTLAGRDGVRVVSTGTNLGPAGGYDRGLRVAIDSGADRVWTVDDDVEPEPGCLERLLSATTSPAVALPTQVRADGVESSPPAWTGAVIDAEVIRAIGYPRSELFFWAEDTEYAVRIRRAGHRRTHVPEAEVLHRNPGARRRGQPRDWQLYYEVRNTLEYRLRIRRRTVKGVARAVGAVLGKLGSILLFEPGKARSLRLWWWGVRDFARGRLGKVVDPATWDEG
jgi:GT2 family glycosyltransferase